MTDTESIENLLEHAYPSPAHWSSTDVADVLVLSLHCTLVLLSLPLLLRVCVRIIV
jgi:hypothetical protein